MQHTRKADVRYLPKQESNSLNLKVNTIGFESIPEHSKYPTTGHPQAYSFNFVNGRILQEFQLIYITRGKGQFTCKQVELCDIQEGTILLIKPGEWHSYRPDEISGWDCYWVGFNGVVPENLIAENPMIQIGYDEEMVSLYRKLLDISNNEKPGYQKLLSGILLHLLAYLFYREQNKNWGDKEILLKIEKAKMIIREKINSTILPEELAAELNISYTWFRRMFRQYTGMAPAQYIVQLKIQKTKELLSISNITIKEVANAMGFESVDYFSTQFRKQTGQTPTQFRLMCRGK